MQHFGTPDEKYMVEICDMQSAYETTPNDESETIQGGGQTLPPIWFSDVLLHEGMAERPSFMVAHTSGSNKFDASGLEHMNDQSIKKVMQHMKK